MDAKKSTQVAVWTRLKQGPWLRASAWLVAVGALALVGQGTAKQLPRAAGASTPSRAGRLPIPKDRGPRRTAASARPRPCPEPPSRTEDKRIVLNTAGIEQLIRLPGIGRKRAGAIVRLRTRLGKFRRLRDLLRIRGLGWRLLKRIRPHVVIDPVRAPPKERKGQKLKPGRDR